MKDLKSGIEHLKQAKAHMSKANGIMSNCISKLKFLEEENAELRAKLADWEGNAEGFEPDAYMKLPLDADGVPICIGDKVNVDGEDMTVLGYRLHDDMLLLVTEDKKRGLVYTSEPSRVRHFKPEPADSWEKLEEDAKQQSCWYFGLDRPPALCDDCPHSQRQTGRACWQNVRLDIIDRAKKLAGIEDLEGGER